MHTILFEITDEAGSVPSFGARLFLTISLDTLALSVRPHPSSLSIFLAFSHYSHYYPQQRGRELSFGVMGNVTEIPAGWENIVERR